MEKIIIIISKFNFVSSSKFLFPRIHTDLGVPGPDAAPSCGFGS